MSMTVAEKILARASGVPSVKAGDVVEPKVDLAMSHENAALVINQFLECIREQPFSQKSGIHQECPSSLIIGCRPSRLRPLQTRKKSGNSLRLSGWENSMTSGETSAESATKSFRRMVMSGQALLSSELTHIQPVTGHSGHSLLASARQKWPVSGHWERSSTWKFPPPSK